MKDVHRQGLLEFALVMAGPRHHSLEMCISTASPGVLQAYRDTALFAVH